jgi:hypothetical protein
MAPHHGPRSAAGASVPTLARFGALDSLPPPPPPAVAASPTAYVYAPGDIYPRGSHEEDLCEKASHPDWFYLGGLALLDAGSFWLGSSATVKYDSSMFLRFTGPSMIGLTWGATVGGAWLALPKCSGHWVGSPPREGDIHASWPVALSLAVLAGVTAPVVYGIAIGSCSPPACQGGLPAGWTTPEREGHIIAAGVAGFGGALLPYLLPPRTWSAAREIDRIRFGIGGNGDFFVGYGAAF